MILLIGDIIKRLREDREIKQQDFAKILNIGKSTLSQYENGLRAPNDETKKMIANYFNVSVDYLLEMTPIPDKIEDYIRKNVGIKKPELSSVLSEDEEQLILDYRKLSEKSKGKIEGIIHGLLMGEEQMSKDA